MNKELFKDYKIGDEIKYIGVVDRFIYEGKTLKVSAVVDSGAFIRVDNEKIPYFLYFEEMSLVTNTAPLPDKGIPMVFNKEETEDIINNPNHYHDRKIEPIDVIEDNLEAHEGVYDGKDAYYASQSLKYDLRAGLKIYPGKTADESMLIDLEKSAYYKKKQIEHKKKQIELKRKREWSSDLWNKLL